MEQDPTHWHLGSDVKVISFSIAVFYFDRLIALVDTAGRLVWRDHRFPIFLIDYLVANPQPNPEKVRMN